MVETLTSSAQDLAWTGGGGGGGTAGSGATSVTAVAVVGAPGVASLRVASLRVASFDTDSEGIGTTGAAVASCLGSFGATDFAATLEIGALALIIGTAGRAGITGTGEILCTVAVVAEEGAVDIEVGGFTEPASEGGRVVVGVGISDTVEGGTVVAGIGASGARGFVVSGSVIGSETGVGTGAGTGIGTGTEDGTGASTGVGTSAGFGVGAGTGTAAAANFLRRRRLLAGNDSSGADSHGSLIVY